MRFPKNSFPVGALALALTLSGISTATQADNAVSLTHVHGLSYSADGAQLMIPSHHGMAIYETGPKAHWSKAQGPAHDYMGFSATREAIYSSGHPAPGSGLTNPFGVIKSIDGGKTWRNLGLEGESDFHLLATSYGTNAVFVLNYRANSRMSSPGLYHTESDGMKWVHATAQGLSGQIKSLAVHPNDARIVAAGTDNGLYLSRDAGETFSQRVAGRPVLGIGFEMDGRHIVFGSYVGKATLSRIGMAPGAEPQDIPIPELREDAIAYVAQNPMRPAEMAIASYKRNVFISRDERRTWKPIAADGATHE